MATYCVVEDVAEELQLEPGEWIDLTADSGSGEANPDRVHVGVNELTRFPIGAIVEVAELSAGGKITRVERGTVASWVPGNTYITLDANLTEDFDIADNAAIRTVAPWDNFTTPRYSHVKNLIEENEDLIDVRTHATWMTRAETEWHAFATRWRNAIYPSPMISGVFGERSTYAGVRLNRRNILTLDESEGDWLKIWNGSAYEEWVDSTDPLYVVRTESRDDDYWVNYEDGILYFVKEKPYAGDMAIKIHYRYSNGNVMGAAHTDPAMKEIKRACKLLTASDLLRNERYQVNFPGGDEAGAMGLSVTASSMARKADRILARHTEIIAYMDDW